jgi:hypothetical protein
LTRGRPERWGAGEELTVVRTCSQRRGKQGRDEGGGGREGKGKGLGFGEDLRREREQVEGDLAGGGQRRKGTSRSLRVLSWKTTSDEKKRRYRFVSGRARPKEKKRG